jgi:hypothetical protein
MKKLILVIFLSLPMPMAFSGIAKTTILDGRISRIEANQVVLYTQGTLILVPKKLIREKNLKIGQQLILDVTLDQMRSFQNEEVPLKLSQN